MNFPASFLLGIGVILVHEQFYEPLPGSSAGDAKSVEMTLLLLWMFVPWLAARLLSWQIRRQLLRFGGLSRATFESLRLPGLLIPAVYAGWMFFGDYGEWIFEVAPTSLFLQHVLLIGPLFVMEVSVRLAEGRIVRFLERARGVALNALGPRRLPMVLFVVVPILLFSLAADLVMAVRPLEVFLDGTALGSSVGILALAFALCVSLPMFFRWTQPTSTNLPENVAMDVRETANALGFSPSNVLVLHSGRRVVNAAMVGPLPWPRYLVLSDGILALLERTPLRGVIAHEIGHARANHPGLLMLLFVVIPVLLLHPIALIDFESISTSVLVFAAALSAVFGIVMLRRIAHQFEFEADRISAETLGGARPCIDALQRVGELDPSHRYKSSFRHPSEAERVAQLQAWDQGGPEFRQAVMARSRRLRVLVFGLTTVAAVVSIAVHVRLWSYDRAVYSLFTGDIGGARAQLAELEPDPPFFASEDVESLRAEADAAFDLVGTGGPGQWTELQRPLAAAAWERAIVELSTRGVDSAGPWLSLALANPPSSGLQRSVALYARAVGDDRPERAEALARHILDLDPPPRLAEFFRRVLADAGPSPQQR